MIENKKWKMKNNTKNEKQSIKNIKSLCCIFEITKKESTVSLTQLELQNEDFDREKEVEVNYSSVWNNVLAQGISSYARSKISIIWDRPLRI